jgi:hypothetical protein
VTWSRSGRCGERHDGRIVPDVPEEIDPVEQLHRQHPVLAVADQLVERDEVGMDDVQQSAELMLESEQRDRAGAVHGLERDVALVPAIVRAIDGPHAAAAQHAEDLEAVDAGPVRVSGDGDRDRDRGPDTAEIRPGTRGRLDSGPAVEAAVSRRRGEVEGRLVEGDVERPAGPQRLVDLELGAKGLGVDGEPFEILVKPRDLAVLFAEDDLVVDQVQEGRGPDPGEVRSLQIRLDPDPLPAPPAFPVILHQGERAGLAVASR